MHQIVMTKHLLSNQWADFSERSKIQNQIPSIRVGGRGALKMHEFLQSHGSQHDLRWKGFHAHHEGLSTSTVPFTSSSRQKTWCIQASGQGHISFSNIYPCIRIQ